MDTMRLMSLFRVIARTPTGIRLKSWHVLKGKLARQELSVTFSNENHRQLVDNLSLTHGRFSKKFVKFCGNVALFDSHQNGL